MGHGHDVLIKDMLVFLFAAGVFVPLLRLGRLPAVAGFIFAGVALGPFGLGALSDRWPVLQYFTISDPEAAAPFGELGVLFLLFLLGLELSFEKLWALRRIVFGTGALQSGLSALAIGGVAVALGVDAPAAVVFGLALALSSTAIVMQLLIEQRRATTPTGRTALGVLLFQDLLVAPILIFVGFASQSGEGGLWASILEALINGTLAVLIIFVIGRFVLRHVFRLAAHAGGRDFLMALTLLTAVGASVITASAGLSLALGAFLAGILLGETEFKHQTEVDLEPFKGLLLGLFFMTVGMSLDLFAIRDNVLVIAGLLAGLLVIKYLIAAGAVRVMSGSGAPAISAAGLLAPAGEFAFVILGAALAGGIIDAEQATMVGAVAGLSMLLIPLFDRLAVVASKRFAPAAQAPSHLMNYTDLEGHVIVAGFGRVGHATASVLRSEGMELVALDRDVNRVRRERKAGWKVYFGDAAREEILIRAGGKGASMFVVTVDDPMSAEAMVRAARRLRPEAPILARATDAEHAHVLRHAGANYVIPDAIEAGLQMASRALQDVGYEGETVRDRIAAVREEAYRQGTE